MSTAAESGGFWSGLASGGVVGILIALIVTLAGGNSLLGATSDLWNLERSLGWAYQNLGFSMPVFGLVLVLYVVSLFGLRRCIDEERRVDEVAHAEHLTDTWTSLFFGVGVIWTAIGMRGALLYALGDLENGVTDGAFAVLQRMVNGGILVALSTTIFGGIGGYLMGIVKTMVVGAPLKRYYDNVVRESSHEVHAKLGAIEQHLASLSQQDIEDNNHERPVSAEVPDPRGA